MERIKMYETQNYDFIINKIVNGSVSSDQANKSIENACKAKRIAVQLSLNININEIDLQKALRSAENALVYAEILIK